MRTWQEIRDELEKVQKLYSNEQFLDFLSTAFIVKEVDRELLYKVLTEKTDLVGV